MQIKNDQFNTLSLENFEGPLAFLHYLVQKCEIDIGEVSLQQITEQYHTHLLEQGLVDLDSGADFIDHAGAMIWLKSKMLLPSLNNDDETVAVIPPFDVIPHLLEYCRFKDLAKNLSTREERESECFPRGLLPNEEEFSKPLGIERVSLIELETLFQEMLEKAAQRPPSTISEEEWRVSDQIKTIRIKLKTTLSFRFRDLFSLNSCKNGVVVIFLAVLELIKMGELKLNFYEGDLTLSSQELNKPEEALV